ncbi:MAG TPA: nucleotide-binding protein [Methanoregulaceae archaeon]|nr:nucleotide-binding protein [Methanoregulaceae archaeon]
MDISQIVERISQKIESKGHPADKQKIEQKVRRLIDEFGLQPADAERTVLFDTARDYGVQLAGSSGPGEKKAINEIGPEDWVTIEGKIVALTGSPSPSIAYTGIIADNSGAIRFVVWAKASAPSLKAGTWYRFESAVVDEFKGALNLKIHSGTTVTELEEDEVLIPVITPLAELAPGVASVRAKVVQEWDATHDRMLQSGLLGDESGTVKFVTWKEEGKEKLVPGGVYNVYYALVDEFNGRYSLNLNTATIVPEEGDIEVTSGSATIQGVLVHVAPGSGIIKRCPQEGCNRVLSRQNYCPVHEMQTGFKYDLRIKGWLDNGQVTHEILLQKDAVEKLTGMTLAESQELAENNPLGMDEVFLRMRERILGRYLRCEGKEIDRRVLVNTCERTGFDPVLLADLLNRTGGETA